MNIYAYSIFEASSLPDLSVAVIELQAVIIFTFAHGDVCTDVCLELTAQSIEALNHFATSTLIFAMHPDLEVDSELTCPSQNCALSLRSATRLVYPANSSTRLHEQGSVKVRKVPR